MRPGTASLRTHVARTLALWGGLGLALVAALFLVEAQRALAGTASGRVMNPYDTNGAQAIVRITDMFGSGDVVVASIATEPTGVFTTPVLTDGGYFYFQALQNESSPYADSGHELFQIIPSTSVTVHVEPIQVTGTVRNTTGTIVTSATVTMTLLAPAPPGPGLPRPPAPGDLDRRTSSGPTTGSYKFGMLDSSGNATGTYGVRALPPSSGPHSGLQASPVVTFYHAPGMTHTVNLTLTPPSPSITGWVVLTNGTRVTRTGVLAFSFGGGGGCCGPQAGPGVRQPPPGGGPPQMTQTDDDGVFTFTGLESGFFDIIGTAPPRPGFDNWADSDPAMISYAGILTTTGPLTLTVVSLRGTVVDPSGNVVTDSVNIEAYNDSFTEHRFGPVDSTNGQFAFGFSPGHVFVQAHVFGGRGPSSLAPAPLAGSGGLSDSPLYEFDVPEGGGVVSSFITLAVPSILGLLNQPNGDPVPYAWVNLHNISFTVQQGSPTDISGTFSFGGLPNGPYVIEAGPSWDLMDQFSPAVPRDVTVTQGVSVSVIMTLTRPVITGTVEMPAGYGGFAAGGGGVAQGGGGAYGAGVRAANGDFSIVRESGTDFDGNFAFGGLPTGVYTIEAFPPFWLQGLSSPDPRVVTVTNVLSTVNAGIFVFGTPNKHIAGRVFMGGESDFNISSRLQAVRATGVQGAMIWAFRNDGFGYAQSAVSNTAPFSYTLDVSEGNWMVGIGPDFRPDAPVPNFIFDLPPISVVITPGSEAVTRTLDLTVTSADAGFTGRLVDPDGNSVFSARAAAMAQALAAQQAAAGRPPKVVGARGVGVTAKPRPPAPQVNGVAVGPGGGTGLFLGAWSDRGRGNGTEILSNGRFTVSLPSGNYHVELFSSDPGFSLTLPSNVRQVQVTSTVRNLGDVQLTGRNSRIRVLVEDNNGSAVSDMEVGAFSFDSGAFAHGTTVTGGVTSLAVVPGTWLVQAFPWGTRYSIINTPDEVLVGDNQTKSVTITLGVADAGISGRVVVSGSTSPINDLYGFVWAEDAGAGGLSVRSVGGGQGPVMGGAGPIDSGTFNFVVPSGTYNLNAVFPPGIDYTIVGGTSTTPSGAGVRSAADNVAARTGLTTTVTLTVGTNNAFITGTLYNLNSEVITNVSADIFLHGDTAGDQFTSVDTSTGTYSRSVGAGTWAMNAWPAWGSNYFVQQRATNTVVIANNETKRYDFTLLQAGARIQGTVRDISGTAMGNTMVFAEQLVDTSTGQRLHNEASTDEDGAYQMDVVGGTTYRVGAGANFDLGLIPPAFISVTLGNTDTVTRNFTFTVANAFITGTTVLTTGAPITAFVRGWSDDGGLTFGESSGGLYSVQASGGTDWHLSAAYEDATNGILYRSPEVTVPASALAGVSPTAPGIRGTAANITLTLSLTQTLPSSESTSFEASNSQTILLSDGTEIYVPATALALSGTVTIIATPKGELPIQGNTRLIGLGYTLEARDSNGQTISSFNQNVQITLHYTDDQWQALGINETDLVPSYFDTLSSSWRQVTNVVQDTTNNKLVFSVSHFTDYGVTGTVGGGGVSSTPTMTQKLYLPLVVRSYAGGW